MVALETRRKRVLDLAYRRRVLPLTKQGSLPCFQTMGWFFPQAQPSSAAPPASFANSQRFLYVKHQVLHKASISLFFHGLLVGLSADLKSAWKLSIKSDISVLSERTGHLSAGMVVGASSASASHAAFRDLGFPWQIFLSPVQIRLNCYFHLNCNGFLFCLPQPTSEADIISQHSLWNANQTPNGKCLE